MSKFQSAISIMEELHSKKNHDYTTSTEFENFELVATMTGLDPEDVMLVHICNKIARLKALREKDANFESTEDTLKDLAVYSTILYSYKL